MCEQIQPETNRLAQRFPDFSLRALYILWRMDVFHKTALKALLVLCGFNSRLAVFPKQGSSPCRFIAVSGQSSSSAFRSAFRCLKGCNKGRVKGCETEFAVKTGKSRQYLTWSTVAEQRWWCCFSQLAVSSAVVKQTYLQNDSRF